MSYWCSQISTKSSVLTLFLQEATSTGLILPAFVKSVGDNIYRQMWLLRSI